MAADRPLLLFAYGSLIQRSARVTTVPAAGTAYPVLVRGLRRGWWFQYEPEKGPTLSPTYLGAQADPDATCNGVVFALPRTGLEKLEWREQDYVRKTLDPRNIEVLAGDVSLAGAEVAYYSSPARHTATATHPIVQSYVDVCVGGCLEIEEAFPEARAIGFARQFVLGTDDWHGPWMNDRINPWRPSVAEPRAWDIDALLFDALGADRFREIKVPGL